MTPSRPRRDHSWISLRSGWLLGLALACTACWSEASYTLTATGPASGTGDPTQPNASARELFDAVEPDLLAACSGCHESGPAPFLALPDRYETIVAWSGIVVDNPNQSSLLTYPRAGTGHVGINLDTGDLDDTLTPRLREWLTREAEQRTTPHPNTEPFQVKPGYFNVIELGALGAGLEGAAVTFDAEEPSPTSLKMTNLHLHAAGNDVRVVHPLFAVIDDDDHADPDPADSLALVDQRFEAGEKGEIEPGILILTNWTSGSRLVLAFEVIEPL